MRVNVYRSCRSPLACGTTKGTCFSKDMWFLSILWTDSHKYANGILRVLRRSCIFMFTKIVFFIIILVVPLLVSRSTQSSLRRSGCVLVKAHVSISACTVDELIELTKIRHWDYYGFIWTECVLYQISIWRGKQSLVFSIRDQGRKPENCHMFLCYCID